MTFDTIGTMSERDMRNTVCDILIGNGMDEWCAEDTVEQMSTTDLEMFLIDSCQGNE
jgi:hypothetical protein